jgi:hypothetical protein
MTSNNFLVFNIFNIKKYNIHIIIKHWFYLFLLFIIFHKNILNL